MVTELRGHFGFLQKSIVKYVSMPTLGEMAAVFHLACDDVRGHGTLTSMLLHGLFVCLLK